MKKPWQSYILAIVLIIAVSLSKIIELLTDFWWFSALHFEQIFTTVLKTKIALFVGAAVIFYLFVLINLKIAKRVSKSAFFERFIHGAILAVSLIFGLSASNAWLTVLSYLNQVSFDLADPILGMDASFYVFSLPLLLMLWSYAFFAIIITMIVVGAFYFQKFIKDMLSPGQVDPNTNTVYKKPVTFKLSDLTKPAITHLGILASLLFVLLALRHYLSRFSVMFSESGIVVGAGYTDVNVFLPVVSILSIFALVIAVVLFVWIFVRQKKPVKKRHLLVFLFVAYGAVVFLGGSVVPAIVQSLVVSPNEINLESPYIANNIEFTKAAYGLQDVEEKDFPVEQSIDQQKLKDAKETIDNVRILDYRPLTQTYKQTQEIRLYYDLSGIDIDRYNIDGKYTQVMLAPREMDQKQIASNAQTWVNLHMVYTHGFGVVMSPVNEVTNEGLPKYLIQDIPPVYKVEEESIEVEQPRVYYGEQDNNYVLVNTKTEEFDFPKGNTNEYIRYDGKGGVSLDSFGRKLALAIRFKDIKLLLSSEISPESKIMFDRSIQKRISKLTPFFALDNDPYLVIDDKRLFWIQDAYTVTGNFPYSQKYRSINYMRNSVKIVVDAYNGDVTYYVIDKQDPIIRTYARIFPQQFKQIESMPQSLRAHLRYPEDLFKVQSEIYSTYHMEDVTVFYNKEDTWEIPLEIYGTGQQVRVEPYYIILKLPGEEKEEFVLMTTFTPIKKDNMISWLAARSDDENYGKLLLYKFPKDKLIFGPSQIEAKFDQDSEISQQLTLWSQQGSRVTRGNLLVIPIENSLLYIEPLYIQAERGQLPELKRVLVSDGERVVMEKDVDAALSVLFGKPKPVVIDDRGLETPAVDTQSAQFYYQAILEAMERGDWESFGNNFEKLGNAIEDLE